MDVDFKEHHYAVIDLVGDDEQKLDEEQAVMGNHEDKVAEITECLQQLWPESKAASSAAHSMGHSHYLRRQLNNMERNLHLVKGKIDPLISGPGLDTSFLLQLEEQVGSIKINLLDVTRVILFSEREEEDLL